MMQRSSSSSNEVVAPFEYDSQGYDYSGTVLQSQAGSNRLGQAPGHRVITYVIAPWPGAK